MRRCLLGSSGDLHQLQNLLASLRKKHPKVHHPSLPAGCVRYVPFHAWTVEQKWAQPFPESFEWHAHARGWPGQGGHPNRQMFAGRPIGAQARSISFAKPPHFLSSLDKEGLFGYLSGLVPPQKFANLGTRMAPELLDGDP